MNLEPNPEVPIDEPLMAACEAAAFIGLPSPRHLSRLHATKAGPRCFQLGKRRYYRRADVLAWLAERCVDPARQCQAA